MWSLAALLAFKHSKNSKNSMNRHVYYTKEDVAQHCTADDCWISHHGRVFNYTSIIKSNPANLVESIVRAAGGDITSWFDPTTGDPFIMEDPITGENLYRHPNGLPLLHSCIPYPAMDMPVPPETPWWRDTSYEIGLLSKNSRPLEILNTLTEHRHTIIVPEEETLAEIAARYSRFNSVALTGYRWKYLGEDLHMDKTLSENGIKDERDVYLRLNWPQSEWYTPCITLIWKDELI